MKRNELRIRRNFHVSKRITNRLERQYGISIETPYARDTVPAAITSSRQQLRKSPEIRSPPAIAKYGIEPQDSAFHSRQRFLSAFACLSPDDAAEWAHDDYLALQLGPHSTGTQKSNPSHVRHPDCDEPECGSSDWMCDLCQEATTAPRDESFSEFSPSSTILDTPRDIIQRDHSCERVLSIKQFIETCPLALAIRQVRKRKRPCDIEEHFDISLFNIEDIPAAIILEENQHCSSEDNVTLPPSHLGLPSSKERVRLPQESPASLRVDELTIVLAYLLSVCNVGPPTHKPGVDLCNRVLSITREQGFVFDRGKPCSCGLWTSRASSRSHSDYRDPLRSYHHVGQSV